MKSVKILVITFITILLINCSTPYQPKGALGGYSSIKIENDTYKVEFKGNQHTKADVVFDNLERRCAEIAIENGFDYFVIYEDSSYIDRAEFDNSATLDEQLDVFQDPRRNDNYLLDRKPELTRDPIEIILSDHHSRLGRTYGQYFIDNQMTDVTGVFKIMVVNDIVENFKDFYHPASEILIKYKD